MNKNRQQKIYKLLKRGIKLTESSGELSLEWAREFFPPERREYEFIYHGKESEDKKIIGVIRYKSFGGTEAP